MHKKNNNHQFPHFSLIAKPDWHILLARSWYVEVYGIGVQISYNILLTTTTTELMIYVETAFSKSFVVTDLYYGIPLLRYDTNPLRKIIISTKQWLKHQSLTSQYGVNEHTLVMIINSGKLSHWTTSSSWWHHQMETFSVLLALCAGNSLVPSEFPSQRSVTWSFDVFFDLRLNKWLSKQSKCRWFEMPSHSLLCHCNASLMNECWHIVKLIIAIKLYEILFKMKIFC